jgi:hypothetical protein
MDHAELESRLARIPAKYEARPDTNMVQFELSSRSRDWQWRWAAEGASRQYFIASTTKLCVTAIIVQLRAEGVTSAFKHPIQPPER